MKMNRGRGEDEKTVPLPGQPCFDNEQLDLLLRALPLEAGWKGGIRLFAVSYTHLDVYKRQAVQGQRLSIAALLQRAWATSRRLIVAALSTFSTRKT